MTRWFTGMLAAAALTLVPTVASQAEPVGEYSGMIVVGGMPQPVWLKLNNVQMGQSDNLVTFSKPRDCWLDFEYGGAVDGLHFFYLDDYRNDWCKDTANRGEVVLKVREVNGRDIEYSLELDGKPIETAIVSKN